MVFTLGHRSQHRELSEILAACLDSIDGPEGIPGCLRRYPEHAPELEPLLRTALATHSRLTPPVRESRRLAARSEFLRAAARESRATALAPNRRIDAQRPPSVLTRPLWSAFAPAIVAAMLFVVAIIPIMSITSSTALPGDWNYGFKRSTERVRLALTLSPADRLNLELAFHNRRLGEIEQLAAAGRLNDPSLVQELTTETSALVQSVSRNPQLGPSEALKVAQQTQAQVQALSDKVAPLAPASIKPAINDAVEQTQQVQAKASEVAQAKADSATQTQSSESPLKPPHNEAGSKSTLTTPASEIAAANSTASATATPTGTASPTATPTITATAVPSATPTSTSTAVAIVPPPQAQPVQRPPVAASAPVLRPPTNPQQSTVPAPQQSSVAAVSTPAPTPTATPLVPPSQPPNGQQVVVKLLPAGQQSTFVYTGAKTSIPQALASISGAYDAVFYTLPENGGQVYEWRPGQSNPLDAIEPGSLVTIQVKPGASATLTYVVASNGASH
jgi:hypothetical protein